MDKDATDDAPYPKIPIGVPSLDNRLDGGVRPGTTILALGSFGSGYHEFLRTAAVMHGNWKAKSGLFELEYGTVNDAVVQPSQIRYISLNDSELAFRRYIHDLTEEDVAYPALEHINLRSLAEEIADLGPLAPSARGFEYRDEQERSGDDYEDFFRRLDDLVEGAPGEVVFIDSITDLLPITAKFLDPVDLYFISQTLCHVAAKSDSVIVAAADKELLDREQLALLKRTFEAVLDFGWFGQGTAMRRTLTITKFPQFWREYDSEGRVMFDLEIDREHFGISEIRKIPAGR